MKVLFLLCVVILAFGTSYIYQLPTTTPPPEQHKASKHNQSESDQVIQIRQKTQSTNSAPIQQDINYVDHLQRIRSERNERLHQFHDLATETLVNKLHQAIADGNDKTINIINSLLIRRAQDDPLVADYLEQLFNKPDANKEHLIWLLAQMATPASLDILINVAQQQEQVTASVRSQTLNNIANIGTKRDANGRIKSELTAVLLDRFSSGQEDDTLFKAISFGLGSIGDEKGVEALLAFANGNKNNPDQQEIVRRSLLKIRNRAAIGPLLQQLQSDPQLSDPISVNSADAIANMGKPEATQALLEWSSTVQTLEQQEQIISWFSHVRDSTSIDMILSSADKFAFANSDLLKKIQETIQAKSNQQTPMEHNKISSPNNQN